MFFICTHVHTTTSSFNVSLDVLLLLVYVSLQSWVLSELFLGIRHTIQLGWVVFLSFAASCHLLSVVINMGMGKLVGFAWV
jgi:hypothetical protein